MMDYDDCNTIKNMIRKRLEEPGKTEIADIQVVNKPDDTPPHIQVGVWFVLKDRLGHEGLVDTRSFFDLPPQFQRIQVLNEIDQIGEQLKEVRRKTSIGALVFRPGQRHPREMVKGTGLRGLWPQ